MARVIEIPEAMLGRQKNQNFHIVGGSTSSGPGLNGREQIVYTEDRRWTGQIDFAHIFGADILGARVVGDRLRGRANPMRVPICNLGTPRFSGDVTAFYKSIGLPDDIASLGYIPFSDGATFSDGAGFALPDYGEPTIAEDASIGASRIRVYGYIGRNQIPGTGFSINDFFYRVEENNDGHMAINPPLREAVSAGDTINVSKPTIRVRLATNDGWQQFVEYGRVGKPMSINVVEVFER